MNESKQLVFECLCGAKSVGFNGLYQSDTDEICATWKCDMCERTCIAVIAGMKPVLPWYTKEDTAFLKSCNVEAP